MRPDLEELTPGCNRQTAVSESDLNAQKSKGKMPLQYGLHSLMLVTSQIGLSIHVVPAMYTVLRPDLHMLADHVYIINDRALRHSHFL